MAGSPGPRSDRTPRRPRPRRLRNTGDEQVDAAIDALIALRADHPEADLVREMLVTAMKFLYGPANRGAVRQASIALKEIRYATKVFAPYAGVRKATVFGSARIAPGDPSWEQAAALSRRIADAGWMVISGAGPGIMQAANEGAGRDRSFGVNIRLPFEQAANPAVLGSPNLITFRYFFTRKLFFVRESHAVVLFPGGFGTLDEGMEVLTLIQTGKTHPIPVVMIDPPGGDYWKSARALLERSLLARRYIHPEDMGLFRVTESVEEAVKEILGFYRNFHSSRHLGDEFVLRLHRPPPKGEIEAITAEFADILAKDGKFEAYRGRRKGEDPDAEGTPPWRLALGFDKRSYGRLRQLIDRVNRW